MRVELQRSWLCALLLAGCSAEPESRADSGTASANHGQPGHAPATSGATGGAPHHGADASVPTTHIGTGLEPGHGVTASDGGSLDGGRATPGEPPSLVMCDPPASTAAQLDFKIEWQWRDVDATEPGLPLVANLTDDNGDGVIDTRDTPDVVMHEQIGGALVVLDGATGLEQTRIEGIAPYGAHPAIGDVDGDGHAEIISIEDLYLSAHDGAGHELWRADMPSDATGTSTLTLADVDQDGVAEILSDRAVFDARGQLLRTLNAGGSFGPPVAADLDADGALEILYAGIAFHADGRSAFSINEGEQTYAAVADLDADGTPEVVLVTIGVLLVLEHDGRERKRVTLPASGNLLIEGQLAPPLVADLDGDARPEIGVAGENRYSVYRADLSMAWNADVDRGSGSSLWGASAFDFDGDGTLEIAYADQTRLHVFDGASGSERWGYALPGPSQTGYPVIADIDNDGSAEILLSVREDERVALLIAFGAAQGSFMPARRIWNQYNYVADNVNEDASLVFPDPGSWRLTNTFRAQARIDDHGKLCAPARVH